MVRVEGDKVTIRPLAGTRPRGRTEEEDDRLAAELIADPKERAEHIMLVDLGRNDVGRVARYGTVQLSDVMTVERYSHVMHLCSTVTGRLQPGKTAFDALRSCLPAGTLSGAPKVRAMEIIDELEPHRRGPYGGAVGYVDFSGNMDTCIALRTMVLKGQTAYLQAGAGIVADSVPAQRARGDAEQGARLATGAGDGGAAAITWEDVPATSQAVNEIGETMFKQLRVENFKAWQGKREVELAPLSLFLGTNSAGKTSLLQMLLLLKQTAESPDRRQHLNLGGQPGDVLHLGGFRDVISGHDLKRELAFGLRFAGIADN